jgi:hypothetical protein
MIVYDHPSTACSLGSSLSGHLSHLPACLLRSPAAVPVLTAGVDGIHCVSGTCDLCGDTCDANTQELNVLTCTFKNCQDLPYHQDCLEKVCGALQDTKPCLDC